MILKPLSEISSADLDELVTNAVPEGRNIDFKRDLCGNSDADKKELLADVSSFANANGGDLLFGVDEVDGTASSIPGLAGFDSDATILRFESSIRDGIEPRIPGIQFQVVDRPNDPVLIVRVPNSWAGPHMVTFKNNSRFYSRGSAGKFQLDVSEIRAAFDSSGLLAKRVTEWRTDRLGKVIAGDGPFSLAKRSCVVVHVVPLASFGDAKFTAAELSDRDLHFPPIDSSGWNTRLNLDGIVCYRENGDDTRTAIMYTQVFRSGSIEAVSSRLVSERDDERFIASVAYERNIVRSVQTYLKSLDTLSVTPPVLLMISLVGVKGAYMYVSGLFPDDNQPFDRDVVVVPEILIDDLSCNVARTLRPAFDMIWNACGYQRSFNFNDNGDWEPRA